MSSHRCGSPGFRIDLDVFDRAFDEISDDDLMLLLSAELENG